MTFLQFLNREEEIDFEIRFFPNGVRKGNPKVLRCVNNVHKTKNDKGEDSLEVTFGLPEEGSLGENEENLRVLVGSRSEIVFALRLAIDRSKNMYFPNNLAGKERYLGATVQLFSRSSFHFNFLEQNENIKIAPLPELFS